MSYLAERRPIKRAEKSAAEKRPLKKRMSKWYRQQFPNQHHVIIPRKNLHPELLEYVDKIRGIGADINNAVTTSFRFMFVEGTQAKRDIANRMVYNGKFLKDGLSLEDYPEIRDIPIQNLVSYFDRAGNLVFTSKYNLFKKVNMYWQLAESIGGKEIYDDGKEGKKIEKKKAAGKLAMYISDLKLAGPTELPLKWQAEIYKLQKIREQTGISIIDFIDDAINRRLSENQMEAELDLIIKSNKLIKDKEKFKIMTLEMWQEYKKSV